MDLQAVPIRVHPPAVGARLHQGGHDMQTQRPRRRLHTLLPSVARTISRQDLRSSQSRGTVHPNLPAVAVVGDKVGAVVEVIGSLATIILTMAAASSVVKVRVIVMPLMTSVSRMTVPPS